MKIEIPSHFDLNYSEKYILYIRVHSEGFSFSLHDPTMESSFFYHEIGGDKQADALTNFKDFFFENEFLTLPYRKIKIVNCTPLFTFIPTAIFEENNKQTFFDFNFSESKGRILSYNLSVPEVTILHAIPEDTYEFLHRSLVSPQFIHYFAPFILYFKEVGKVNNAHKMVVNLQNGGLDALCFSHGKFVLGNHFKLQSINDACYYILFIWKQLKFNQTKDFIFVAGNTNEKTELMEELKKYLYNIIPIHISPETHFFRVDTQLIPFELSSLSLCE